MSRVSSILPDLKSDGSHDVGKIREGSFTARAFENPRGFREVRSQRDGRHSEAMVAKAGDRATLKPRTAANDEISTGDRNVRPKRVKHFLGRLEPISLLESELLPSPDR